MKPRDYALAEQLKAGLYAYDLERRPLPGIAAPEDCEALIEQLLESVHRVKFVAVLRTRELSELRAEPQNELLFDPLKAAILEKNRGNTEEAFWLTFLFVHFGKSSKGGWRYAREVYGRLGEGTKWDWASISADADGFRKWLTAHFNILTRTDVPGGFGNHRKYETLDPASPNGTATVVESYVKWVDPPRTHQQLVDQACEETDGDPKRAFDHLYYSMDAVARFGRTARFDYLTMLGKLGLAGIEAPSAYLSQATGPLRGAKLLFGTEMENPGTLDRWLVELDTYLRVGMQVLEDSLCNWQKSPSKFKPFRG